MENQQSNQPTHQTIIVKNEKSMVVSLLLTFFFGPLGLLYSTISGGLIMMAISFVAALFTVGMGLIITWPICMIWGAIAVSNGNKKLTG